MSSEFYFLIRHTPFWAVPTLFIAGEFAYIFWLRKKKNGFKVCSFLVLLSLTALSWYFYAGGPDKAVRKFMKWERSLE